MRLRTNSRTTQIGNVEIHDLFHVLQLEACFPIIRSRSNADNNTNNSRNVSFSYSSLYAIETQLAIIVPCMNEELHIIEGVLRGIPHHCLVILVSNSTHEKFEHECELLKQLCDDTERQGIIIHQQNSALAHAFCAANMPEVVNQTTTPNHVCNGKGEAMMIGVLLAKLANKQFVGFIDADNLVPGSVHEYCKVFAAGINYSLSKAGQFDTTRSTQDFLLPTNSHAMVRIKWNSKAKVVDNEITFPETGRSSRVVNKWMNELLQGIHGDGACAEMIQTANAGEHAMDINLALKLRFATGYAVEPFQYIDMLENFGRVSMGDYEDEASDDSTVRVLQIRTLNPHFHDTGKGSDHIQQMIAQGLGTIYHSRLAQDTLKDAMDRLSPPFRGDGGIPIPQETHVYPSMRKIDLNVFRGAIGSEAMAFNYCF
ncbi:mannosyl-3-phosphoglycerate synthase [Pyrenophora tritici-repentis]|nr:mannosyl-3-phosphoglycerate synthase [Pyrenophora tritici-repentis]